ncbi:MAG: hypothetical protein IKH16_10830 [Selenomonadaceae bacterium]|nr:hypothetical protein [Selenomonadaceae bacterium]MBR4695844.1 hypothetical protein [Selenomonadaceae bacterium]
MVAISKEFKAKLYEIVSLQNSQQGDRYLFAGQSDLTQPFVISVEQKNRGLPKTLDDPQTAYFTSNMSNTGLNVDTTGTLTQMLTLEGSNGETYYLNTMNGYIYTKDFVMNGYKNKVAGGQSCVTAGDEVGTLSCFTATAPPATKVSSFFSESGEFKDSPTFAVEVTNAAGITTSRSVTGYGTSLGLQPWQPGPPPVQGDTATSNMDVDILDANGNVLRTVPAGQTIQLNTTGTTPPEADAVIAQKDTLTSTVTDSNGNDVTFKLATVRQPLVTYQGDAKYISMVKLNGKVEQTSDTVNATGQDLNGCDIFDDANSGNQKTIMSNGKICYVSSGTAMLNNMFTVCVKMEGADPRWMSSDGVTIADMAHSTITTAQSSTAARQNVYDSVANMLDKQNEVITADINDVSGTDVAELAVRLMEAQTIYNMSLSVGSRILPPSLADYLK